MVQFNTASSLQTASSSRHTTSPTATTAMSSTTSPSLQELFSYPAAYVNTTYIARPATQQQLLQQTHALDDTRRLQLLDQLLVDLVPQLPAASQAATADAVHTSINEQLAELRFNRLPSPILSRIFSYLPSKQVLRYRIVSRSWHEAAKLPSSFRCTTDRATVLRLRRAGTVDLSGIKALAVKPDFILPAKRRKQTSANRCARDFLPPSDDLFDVLATSKHAALQSLLLLPSGAGRHDWLRTLCTVADLCRYAFRHQLKHLQCVITRLDDWQYLQAATPFTSLTSCDLQIHGTGLKEQPALAIVLQLMPRLESIALGMTDMPLATLEPVLQLPRLRHLHLELDALGSRDIVADSPEQLLGNEVAAPLLQTLHVVGPPKLLMLLLQDVTRGLGQLAAGVQHLYLRDVEHRRNFTAHLQHCQQLRTLELLSTSHVLYDSDNYRQTFLLVLTMLPKLRVLKLDSMSSGGCLEDDDAENGEMFAGEDGRTRYECWTWDHLEALLRLPLTELCVQKLHPAAGQALGLYLSLQPPTVA